MSDSLHANGDTAPRGLRNALAIVQASVKKAVKLRRKGFALTPRFVCKCCGKVWDKAIVAPNTLPEASLCADCRKMLTDGYTALVTANPDAYAFVMSYQLKEDGLAGKIVQLSAENFAAVKKKFDESKINPTPKT